MKNQKELMVKDLMSINPIYTLPETSIRDAAITMAKADVNSIIITDSNKKVLGIITDEDIVRKVVINKLDPEKIKCKEIMTPNPFTIEPEESVEEVIKIMKELNIRQVPVTRKNILVGMITAKDIIKIQPELFLIFKNQPIEMMKFDDNEKQVCEMCGKLSNELIIYNNMLICHRCYNSITLSKR